MAASCRDCYDVWSAADSKKRAEALDEYSPKCGCESSSFQPPHGTPVHDHEWIVRIITSPDGYDLTTGAIITQKLLALFSLGVSVLRANASREEIEATVTELTGGGAEPRKLVGCVIILTERVRYLVRTERVYCIYDTPDRDKTNHADIFSTKASRREKNDRRYQLNDLFQEHFIALDTVDELVRLMHSKAAPV